jgi:hypothetical protein
VEVAFYIHDSEKRIVGWEASLGKRRLVPGTLMGGARPEVLPHDLVQYIVEAATQYDDGFWGLVAKGATFRSTGRRRTKPGREIIARHRADLMASERLANAHVAAWRAGTRTPVADALDAAARQWSGLSFGERLVFRWPSTAGVVEHA